MRIVVAIAAMVLLAGCSTSPEPIPPSTPEATPTPVDNGLAPYYQQVPDWRDCGDAECTKVIVPLDYDDPAGETIELSMTRVPARGESVGSLFVNPGGPGGSAFDYAKAADYIVSPVIREVYDIVGVDPRGVGFSAPIRCLTDAETDQFSAADGTPDDPAEERTVIEDSTALAEKCSANAGPLLDHMATVYAARDLDIARAVVQDPVLNYLGKSYGTALGVTYMALFPENTGRMILDGVLPADLPNEEISKGQADAFEVAFRHFADECANASNCPFTGDGTQVASQLRDFLRGLDGNPLPTSDGRLLTESLGTFAVLSFLYFPETDYARLRDALVVAVRDGDGTNLIALLDERRNRSPEGEYLDNSSDAFYAVTCADLPFTGSDAEVRALAREWSASAPTFGPALAWGLLVCRDWPAVGDPVPELVTPRTEPLIVGTRFDPATPVQWAERLHELLPGSGLVIWENHNHTAYGEGSECVDETVDDYLLLGELPTAPRLCN
jgi:pimeloyl-ACP methyl ester carboxylesterase